MRAFPCLYLAFFLSTATATQPSADSEEEPAFGSQFRKMATKYAPVSSQDNHLAPSANLVDRQHRQTKEQISTSQLSSFDVEDPDRDSYLSHDYQLANGDRPQSSSTGKEYDPANPHSEPTSSSKRSLASTLYNNWFWEMTLLFVSTMALAAVVLLLYYWDKKPLSQWPSPISLNTLVSTLGTIHKSGLALFIGACLGQQKWNWFSQHADTLKVLETFDGASRGPLGSTRLVYQLLPRWYVTLPNRYLDFDL